MPDGAAQLDGGDPVDQRALAADGRLIRTVRWRLVLWSGLTTLIVLAVLGVALYAVAARSLEATGAAQLEARADAFRRRPDLGRGPDQGFVFGGDASGTFALVADANGDPVGRGSLAVPDGIPLESGIEAARTSGTDTRLGEVGGIPIRARTERIRTSLGTYYIQVIQDRTAEQRTLDAILRVLVVGGGIVVLVALGVGAFYARRALVPIRESLVQQRAALRRQREFAADASHELRTPLTVIRSSVEHLRRSRDAAPRAQALDDIEAEVGHLTALVDDLLLIARSDSGAITLNRLPVDLGDLAADGTGGLVQAGAARGVQLRLDPEPAIVAGDPARLRQLLIILVDNAIRHSPRGGDVVVRVRSRRNEAIVEVDDDGPGIRPEDLPHVFDRFWRAPGAVGGGTGLGLAIARTIVDLHEGRIVVANRPEGGARFTVRLPRAEEPPAAATERERPFATKSL
ncbi:MAG TPA: HAMP domain-containing sensor histidine kinase [Candidatus Limnocylindrales bacterium]|nr:HAMP domain-containing sensor histidine kinase [Candidatus Limnocylindrales bacterium]